MNVILTEDKRLRNGIFVIIHNIAQCAMPFEILSRFHLNGQYFTLVFYHKVELSLLFAVKIEQIVVDSETVGV